MEDVYDQLANASSDQFFAIKERFRREIESERIFDRIKDMQFLLAVLKKRDVLTSENLCVIASFLKRIDLVTAIINGRGTEENYHEDLAFASGDPTGKVYDLISCEIGHKWKAFARALYVPEGIIDSLETNYRMPESVIKVLNYHKERTDPKYWKMCLFEALDKARRKELAFKVQNIFAMHNSL